MCNMNSAAKVRMTAAVIIALRISIGGLLGSTKRDYRGGVKLKHSTARSSKHLILGLLFKVYVYFIIIFGYKWLLVLLII